MLELTSERQVQGSVTRRKSLGLNDRDLDKGRSINRNQRYDVFDRAGIATTGHRGTTCCGSSHSPEWCAGGPPEDARRTFVLPGEWIPSPRELDHDESLGEWVLDVEELATISTTLNTQPRKILDWRTPAEAFAHHLTSVTQLGVATPP